MSPADLKTVQLWLAATNALIEVRIHIAREFRDSEHEKNDRSGDQWPLINTSLAVRDVLGKL